MARPKKHEVPLHIGKIPDHDFFVIATDTM
jgi:hypothetical protein